MQKKSLNRLLSIIKILKKLLTGKILISQKKISIYVSQKSERNINQTLRVLGRHTGEVGKEESTYVIA
ncbi:MAG: hypothetical protein ACXABO_06555 [Promethearchaeota archaeon]